MLDLVRTTRVYTPETVAAMTSAFDKVCQSVSWKVIGNDDMRRKVASIILSHVDRGVRDHIRLSQLALDELTGT